MSEKEIENFKGNLKEIKFIIKSEVDRYLNIYIIYENLFMIQVFVYKTNPVRVILLNLIIKLKGNITDLPLQLFELLELFDLKSLFEVFIFRNPLQQ